LAFLQLFFEASFAAAATRELLSLKKKSLEMKRPSLEMEKASLEKKLPILVLTKAYFPMFHLTV
jgi:hypothetical protein